MELIGENMDEVQKALDARARIEAIPALRDELQIELGLCRDELMGKIESRLFGVQLADFDPDVFKRAIAELRTGVDKKLGAIGARLDRTVDRLGELIKQRDVKTLAVKVAILEKGLPAPPLTIKEWKLDAEGYAAIPTMSDGTTGAKLDLRPMFEAYYADANG
jgi:hypothetical protein